MLACLAGVTLVTSGCDRIGQAVFGYEVPVWTSVVHLADGRVFVTDEYIALDVEWAKPEELPTKTFPAEGIESIIRHQELSGSFDEFSIKTVTDVGVEGTYRGKGGVLLNKKHVDYLRWHFMAHDVQLHASSTIDDVVISIDGVFAGALAPIGKRSEEPEEPPPLPLPR